MGPLTICWICWFVIAWVSRIDGVELGPGGCTFETACDMLEMDSRWELTSGQYLPNAYSPGADHTLASSTGHYIYTASFSSASGRVSLPVVDFTNSDRCLEFYYLMNAHASVTGRMGNLKVWLGMGASDNVRQFLFDATANSGPTWNRGFVELPRGRYRIYFEAYLLDYRKDRIIGLDDITIHRCSSGERARKPPKVLSKCDFENPRTCSLSSAQGAEFLWQKVSAQYGGTENMPVVDHTLKTADGHYMYSLSTPTEGAGKLVQMAISIPSREPYCLDFYYKFFSEQSAAKFFVYTLRQNNVTILWSSDESFHISVEDWTWAAIQLPAGNFDLTFELRSYDLPWLHGSAMFALDDVIISSCELLKSYGSSLVQTKPKVFPSYLTTFFCGFENGDMCGATVEEISAYKWDIQSSWSQSTPTSHSIQGNFLHFNGTSTIFLLNRPPIASLRLPHIWAYDRVCLHFQFLMETSNKVELEVFILGNNISPSTKKQLWVNVGGNGAIWQKVLVRLPYTDFDLYLRARKESLDDYAIIGIDNILIDSCDKLEDIVHPDTRTADRDEEAAGSKEDMAPNDERYTTLPVSTGSDANKHNSPSSVHRYNTGPQPCNCNCTPVCAQSTRAQCNGGSLPTATALAIFLMIYMLLHSQRESASS